MSTIDIQTTIRERFNEYLEANRMRKTPERYEILHACYTIEGSFTIEALLHKLLDEVKFQVSRATLYNTVELLVRAGLLMKHELPHASQFERIDGKRYKCYRICSQCSTMKEFHNVELERAIAGLKTPRFAPSHKTFYVYGLCAKCEAAQRRKLKKKNTDKK